MLTSPSIPPLTAVVYSYKVHVFVATFLCAFDSNIPPPPACFVRARVDPVLQQLVIYIEDPSFACSM